MNLDFLNDISLTKTESRVRSASVDTTPAEGAHLRLFSDGRIFPASQLVEDHSLEYVAKGEEVGRGFDIIDTANFPNYPQDNPRLVMVALVDKDMPKVDLFGSVGYNPEGGAPKTSVLTQGSSTTGKWLIDLLQEVYGIADLFVDNRFVDLVINSDFGLTTENNIYHFPKRVNRGEHKGDVTYQRRTDTEMWPLTLLVQPEEILEVVEQEEQQESMEDSAAEFLSKLGEDEITEENTEDTVKEPQAADDSFIADENELLD